MSKLEGHLDFVVEAFTYGEVIPFLGAGAARCGHPEGAIFKQGETLPTGVELAKILVEVLKREKGLDVDDEKFQQDLLRVSEYFLLKNDEQRLYRQLHKVFNDSYGLTALHEFLARLPSLLQSKGYPHGHLLIMTTNYDDLLERAFKKAGEPYDIVSYEAKQRHEGFGKFQHQLYQGERKIIHDPANYYGVSLDNGSVILKIHGAIDRADKANDSYVITENNYIDYLALIDAYNLFPARLKPKIQDSRFLFLGYSLNDWNMRAILRQIEVCRPLGLKSWAIQKGATPIDCEIWEARNLEILDLKTLGIDLACYIEHLDRRLKALPVAGGVISS